MVQHIKRRFKDLSIKKKIIVVFIPLIVIPLLFISFFLNKIFTNNVISKTKNNISANSRLVINQIEGTLINSESFANMLTINLSTILLENEYGDKKDLSLLTNKINGEISKALVIFPDVDSAAFIDKNMYLYTNSTQLSDYKEQPLYKSIIKSVDNTNGINLYFPMSRRDFLVTDKNVPVLTIGKKVFDVVSGESYGSLIVNIKESTFSKIFKSLRSDKSSTYFIADEKNVILSSSDTRDVLTNLENQSLIDLRKNGNNYAEIIPYKGEKMLITYTSFNKNTWSLFTVTPISELTKDASKITNLIIVVTILCLVFALVGAGLLRHVISNPIIRLNDEMTLIQKDSLDIQFVVDSTDEIGSLSKGIQSMLKRVKELIEKVNFEQKRKREYELALINSQIKPHFLYNTLDVIYVLSDLGKHEEVKRTTKALADFYRAALSKGNDIITLEEEFNTVREYLFIQNIRYSDVFKYSINVDKSILEYSICKLTIQPLVENAIYHGLKQKRGMGLLTIDAFEEKENIIIKIKDDGIGMSQERIEHVLTVGTHKNKASFGMYSVNERIKLYFGESYGLNIVSKLNEGTEITLTIPKRTKGEEANV